MMKKYNLVYKIKILFTIFLISFFFTTCAASAGHETVLTANESQQHFDVNSNMNSSTYRVRKGDTLYSIAWAFEMDFRLLAQMNSLQSPYQIYPGQELQIPSKQKTEVTLSQSMEIINEDDSPSLNLLIWCWPAEGRVVQGFAPRHGGNKGVNIKGYFGQKIRAAADGRVVYGGGNVQGYGNLLIIKHSDSYLSAYAYNSRFLVKQGDWVRSGQIIAEMGSNAAGKTMLHFEVRYNGIPINPATCRFLKCLIS